MAINKPQGWDNVKPLTESVKLPADGYLVKIMGVEVKEFNGNSGEFQRLYISVDITDGEYKGFYANDYRNQQQEDKRWKGIMKLYIPKGDGSEKDSFTASKFKSTMNAVEDSNNGYHFDWDNESGLKDKVVGCLFRNEEWEYNGNRGWKTQPFMFVSTDTIKNNKFTMPKDKPLNKNSVSVSVIPDLKDFEEISVADGDLPF